MKSSKQRRLEIKAKRRARAEAQKVNVFDVLAKLPDGAIEANHAELAHNNTYGQLPEFYVDTPFICVDCGSREVWTAKQQKWWYEIAKGNINSKAIRCRPCRKKLREVKNEQRKHMEEMAKREPHPNEDFFKNTYE